VLERTWYSNITSVAETKLKGRLECKPAYIKTKLKLCFLARKHVSPNTTTTSNLDAFPCKETQRFSKYHYHIKRERFSLQGNTTFLQIPLPHQTGTLFLARKHNVSPNTTTTSNGNVSQLLVLIYTGLHFNLPFNFVPVHL
jgi:hypothetical protein